MLFRSYRLSVFTTVSSTLAPPVLDFSVMSGERPAKRARTASDDAVEGSSSSSSRVKCEDSLWLEDGNIILQCASDEPQTMFRCHKSILSRNSSEFQTMLSSPSPDSSTPYEGVPVLIVPVAADDIRLLLKMMYDPW